MVGPKPHVALLTTLHSDLEFVSYSIKIQSLSDPLFLVGMRKILLGD